MSIVMLCSVPIIHDLLFIEVNLLILSACLASTLPLEEDSPLRASVGLGQSLAPDPSHPDLGLSEQLFDNISKDLI